MGEQKIKYPIYIVSKGRWKNPLTAKCFMSENIEFKILVEPQEYDNYCKTIPEKFVQKLPFSNLGLGSYPARNEAWKDSIINGHLKHWVFDDNIRCFSRLNNGLRVKESALLAITTAESFADRFLNLSLLAFNYRYFVNKETAKPFSINTHCYSAILIKNEIPFRWRMKYNEDVDLCLQALHNRHCTILLNAFLIDKTSTSAKMKGGNQDELYKGNSFEKKVLKSKSLEQVWPQYVQTKVRFGRPHHFVDWKKHFTHPLIKATNE